VYEEYKVEEPSGWLFFDEVAAIDGRKLGAVQADLAAAREQLAATGIHDPEAALARLEPAERQVHDASIEAIEKRCGGLGNPGRNGGHLYRALDLLPLDRRLSSCSRKHRHGDRPMK
jgi:hypothetical protein